MVNVKEKEPNKSIERPFISIFTWFLIKLIRHVTFNNNIDYFSN